MIRSIIAYGDPVLKQKAEKIRKKIGIDVDVKPETVTEENLAPVTSETVNTKEEAPKAEAKKEEAPKAEAEKKTESSLEKK